MGLSSSPDERQLARPVATECGWVRAGTMGVNYFTVSQVIRLISVIKMDTLNIGGTLEDDRGQHWLPDDVTQVSSIHIYKEQSDILVAI